MFRDIRQWMAAVVSGPDTDAGADPERRLHLAAAVLMIEIGLADSGLQDEEIRVMRDALGRVFQLDAGEVDQILELARQEVDHAVSLHEFTHTLNTGLSLEDRARIIELLWRVAFADSVLNKYEEYYIRKIADLLHVPHSAFIQTKLRASGEE